MPKREAVCCFLNPTCRPRLFPSTGVALPPLCQNKRVGFGFSYPLTAPAEKLRTKNLIVNSSMMMRGIEEIK